MSKQGSKKEAIFTLYQKKYPKCLEDIIGFPIEGIKTEVDKGSKKIDLYGFNKKKKLELYVENQLKPSDIKDHIEQKIKPLINGISEGYVIWTATKFRAEHIEEVKLLLKSHPQKYINFYAVEIHPEVLNCINYLNNLYELDVWDKLNILNEIDSKLKTVDKYEQMPPNHIGKAFIGEYLYDFTREDDVKEYMIEQLRERIPYFLNFHGGKKHSQYDRILKIGGGLSDITYLCSAFDFRYRAFTEIRFGLSKASWYYAFKIHEYNLKREIDRNISFNDTNRTIGVYIKSNGNDIPKVTDGLVDIFERFILYFSPYTYGKNKLQSNALTV
ncbi:hypothetical protein [Fictibacillus phosphorivorans]|uniref:hypothetical protein n=1 Tax=Fictibacillus phosphorivorans TaxID=1221500 RepID=UPI001292D8BC|nr:hypothetical protein [Fictibacillus phosphorivorans]MQR93697.1 hypothetical protein [Fictibacillus phosphorivorans]